MSRDALDKETYGVLVGWSHHPMGGRLDLKLQCVQSTRDLKQDAIDSHHFVMTREQAAVLANYLFKIADASPPPRRKGRMARWFAS
jgi:hypothetical protein